MNNQLMEYGKIHLISLMQDLDDLEEQMEKLDENSQEFRDHDYEFNHICGQISGINHILNYAKDLTKSFTKE